MSKVKPKKQTTFIDMTAMSDVTVLLLTFFMLTATFLPKEPVKVLTPMSVVDIKIPESNLLTILISPKGQVFLNFDRPKDKLAVLDKVAQDYKLQFTDKQKKSFVNQATIGVPFAALPKFLDMSTSQQDEILKANGVPSDSTNNQLKEWIKYGRAVNPDMIIAVKSDQTTPYTKIKSVFKTLQDIKENRFNLLTTLKKMPNV